MSQPNTRTNDENRDRDREVREFQTQVTQIQVSSSAAASGGSPSCVNKGGGPTVAAAAGDRDQEPNSKSSSTKSKKSKVSSTPSLENGHGHQHGPVAGSPKPHPLLQDRSSQSSTSIILSQPHPPNSWIEQIQFKAQYCHFRCNDYVSVINSARSLDKVEELGAGATAAGLARQLRAAEQGKRKISSSIEQHPSPPPSTSRQRQCSSSIDKGLTTTTASVSVSPKPPQPHTNPLFCWNFPRVKLPRLFNTKSLDDITNSQALAADAAARRGAKHQQHHKDGRSQSSTSHEIHSVLARTGVTGPTATALKDNNPPSTTPSLPSPGVPHQKKGYKKARRSDEDTCSTEANLGASKLKPSSSSSSSENGATFFRTTRVIDGTGTGGVSTVTTTTTTTTTSTQKQQDSSDHSSKKQKHGFINCAKSDTCINRVHVHSLNRIDPGLEPESQGVHLYAAKLESIFIPCCSNPKVIYDHQTFTPPKTNSVDNLDIVPLIPIPDHKPEIEIVPGDTKSSPLTAVSKVEPSSSSSKKKISFMKPVNKVTPLKTYTDNYEEVVDETEMASELPNSQVGSGSGVTAKPRLVMTSMSYLQRPMSPSPSASTVTVTPGVVMLRQGEKSEGDSAASAGASSARSSNKTRNPTKPCPGNGSAAAGGSSSGVDAGTSTKAEGSGAGVGTGSFSIKNYLGELIKEKCITKRTETKHVERVREKVTDKGRGSGSNRARAPAGVGTGVGVSKNANSSSASSTSKKQPETRSVQSTPLEVFYDKLETVEEHFSSSEPRSSQRQSRSSGPSSSVTSPDSGADDFKGAGSTHQEAAIMSDLQSPQYVKKTAHMFNSKMDSATSILHRNTATTTNTTSTSTTTLGNSDPYYSSSFLLPVTNDSNSGSKDGKVRHIAIERNVNGNGATPSYLNVAKSVSGYHGLAYNSASSEKSNGHLLNGSSGLKSPGGGANGVLRTQINTSPQYSSPHKVSFMNDDHDGHAENGDQPLAPPLPKSCQPLSSPSLVNTNSSSSYKKVANSSSSVGNEFYEESSEKHHVIKSQSQKSGISPSDKPAVPEKSKVLEQIQKLYGDQPVPGNSQPVLFRRHYSPQRPTESSTSTTTGKVTTIPIQCTNLNTGKENNTNPRNIVINKAQERIIPITVDPYLQESSRASQSQNARNKTQDFQERYEKEERVYEGVNVKSSPGRHNLFEFEKYSNTNEVNFNTTQNSNSNTSSSKTDLTNNVGKINGSNISQINIHRDNGSADKNIHKTSITIPINVERNGTRAAGAHSGSPDKQTEKCKPVSSNLGSNDTVDASSSLYSRKSAVTNSVSSSPPKQSNVKIIPVKVQNDLESDRDQSRNQNLTREISMAAAKTQSVSNSLNKENDFPTSAVVKDGNYFLQEVHNEKAKIQKLITAATEKLEKLDPSSEESGCVQAAIGKARLLINKKFKQFEELCHTNVKEQSQGTSGEPFTTQNDDLAGFWDMVLIQVDQIHQMFRELDPNYQKNSARGSGTPLYQRSALTPRKDVLKKTGSPTKTTTPKVKPTTSSSTPNARDELRRKMIEERRKAMKNAGSPNGATSSEPDVQIFVPES